MGISKIIAILKAKASKLISNRGIPSQLVGVTIKRKKIPKVTRERVYFKEIKIKRIKKIQKDKRYPME